MFLTGLARRLSLPLSLVAILVLAGCSGITVDTEAAPLSSFAGRKTYAWVPNPQLGGRMDGSIAGQQVHDSVNQAMEAHGFEPVAAGQDPDMLVHYRVILQRQLGVEGGPGWGGFATYEDVEGTLIIVIENPQNGYFLWRGLAQGTIDPGAGGFGASRNIPASVAKMFAKFPR